MTSATAQPIVYFMAAVAPGGVVSVKIGTTTALAQRLRHIQSADPFARRQRPIVVHLEAGGQQRERERHAQFGPLWITREWFSTGVLADPSVLALGAPDEYIRTHPELRETVVGWIGNRVAPPAEVPSYWTAKEIEDANLPPLERIRAANVLTVWIDGQIDRARKLRDESIKEYRASTASGPTEIAKVAKVSVSTVKAVLR